MTDFEVLKLCEVWSGSAVFAKNYNSPAGPFTIEEPQKVPDQTFQSFTTSKMNISFEQLTCGRILKH